MIQDQKSTYDEWHEQLNSSTESSDPMAFPRYRAAFSGIQGNLKGDLFGIRLRTWGICDMARFCRS